MRRTVDISPLKEFLDQSGVLVNAVEDEVRAKRKEHRKRYKTLHKQLQRRENKEVGVLLSRSKELGRIAAAAKKHKQSLPSFLKSATLAYLDKTFIVPNHELIARLAQMLTDCLNEVQRIAQSKGRHSFQVEEKCGAIEKRIVELESEMKRLFTQPPAIEEAVRDATYKDPQLRLRLLLLLTNTQQP